MVADPHQCRGNIVVPVFADLQLLYFHLHLPQRLEQLVLQLVPPPHQPLQIPLKPLHAPAPHILLPVDVSLSQLVLETGCDVALENYCLPVEVQSFDYLAVAGVETGGKY